MEDNIKVEYRDLKFTYKPASQHLIVKYPKRPNLVFIGVNHFSLNIIIDWYDEIMKVIDIEQQIELLEIANMTSEFELKEIIETMYDYLTVKKREVEDNFYC